MTRIVTSIGEESPEVRLTRLSRSLDIAATRLDHAGYAYDVARKELLEAKSGFDTALHEYELARSAMTR